MSRGVIHDRPAYKRMKRKVEETLGLLLESHSVKKSIRDDDAIVIHGLKPSVSIRGFWLMAGVNELVLDALKKEGIEFTTKVHKKEIVYVLVRVDQEACPPPRTKKIRYEAVLTKGMW